MKSMSKLMAVAIVFGSLSSHAAGSRPETLGTVTGTVQAILALNENPNEVFLSTQNPGADCGKGTPASVWKLTLDPQSGKVIGLNKKQDLSKIQNTRNTLFEASDGTLFTGGGWCLYKPPYFSTDGGETWQPADAGPVHPPNSTFSFVEFKGHVYAGTGYEPHHGQVYRWLGEGNWKRVLDIPPPRSIVHRMVVHQGKMLVGSSIYGWKGRGCENSVPVYVSSDGETFEASKGIPPCCSVQQLLIADGQLVAWVYEYGNSTNRYVYSFTGDGWTKTGNLAQGIHPGYAAVWDACAIFASGQVPGHDRPGLYVSTDLGLTWGQLAVFEGISALHVDGETLYLAARGDDKDTSQIYRIALGDRRVQLAQACACRPTPAKPPQDLVRPSPDGIARVFVELRGGWSAVGQPRRTTHVPLETSIGKLQIPLAKIRLLKMQPDGKSAVVELPGGDRLSGTVEMKDIRIETAFGELNVPFAEMRTLRSVAGWLCLPKSLRRGLVLHFDFELSDGERVIDQSDHGNHATLRGPSLIWDGKAGRAAHFELGDYVNVPTSSSLDLQEMTLSAWVRMEPKEDNRFWIQKGEIGGRGLEFGLQISDARSLGYYLADTSRNYQGGPAVPVSAEKWVHVACTYDGSGKVQLYVDGRAVPLTQQEGSFGKVPQHGYSLKIGAWGKQRFQGDVDEVMVYNRVLSPDEIKRLHALASSGVTRCSKGDKP